MVVVIGGGAGVPGPTVELGYSVIASTRPLPPTGTTGMTTPLGSLDTPSAAAVVVATTAPLLTMVSAA